MSEPRTPRTEAGRALLLDQGSLRRLYDDGDPAFRLAILAIEDEAAAAPPIDVERLARSSHARCIAQWEEDRRTDHDRMLTQHEWDAHIPAARKDAAEYVRLAGPPPEPDWQQMRRDGMVIPFTDEEKAAMEPKRCNLDAYCFRPLGHFGACTPEPKL